MKTLLLFVFFSSIGFANSAPPIQPALRYRHIQDAEGKILATIDLKDSSVDYKEDPKKVVPILISILDSVSAQCQAAQTPKPVEKPKKK